MHRAPPFAVLVLLAFAPAAAAQEPPQGVPSGVATPDAPAPPGAPAAPPTDAPVPPERPVVLPTIRPHLAVGLGGGGEVACFSFEAGLRIHPVVLLYSGWTYGEHLGEVGQHEYTTFSGFQLGYQRTLASWVAGYASAGVGLATYHPLGDLAPSGRAATLELALLFGEERSLNLASVGFQAVLPFATPDLPAGSTLGRSATVFMVKLNPLAVLLAAFTGW